MDPRKAKTLDEACKNQDGTYNGVRALAWMSEALFPGKGLSEGEVKALWEKAQKKKSQEAE